MTVEETDAWYERHAMEARIEPEAEVVQADLDLLRSGC